MLKIPLDSLSRQPFLSRHGFGHLGGQTSTKPGGAASANGRRRSATSIPTTTTIGGTGNFWCGLWLQCTMHQFNILRHQTMLRHVPTEPEVLEAWGRVPRVPVIKEHGISAGCATDNHNDNDNNHNGEIDHQRW